VATIVESKIIPVKINKGDVGKLFTKKELGIKTPDIYEGTVKDFMFFTINKKQFENELHYDGIVYTPKDIKDLVSGNNKVTKAGGLNLKNKRLLVRYHNMGQAAFEFIGMAKNMIRYDQKRNKIFVVVKAVSNKKKSGTTAGKNKK